MQTEAAAKIRLIGTCDCLSDLGGMWKHLAPELKARAKDTRKADLLREQKDAA
jgi:hypothetical protein